MRTIIKNVLVMTLIVCGAIASAQESSNGVTTSNDEENAAMLIELAQQNVSWSGFDVYEDLLEIGEMIKNRQLFYITTEKDGKTYTGWVDKNGVPFGLFEIKKQNGSEFVSAYKKGVPFAYGYIWDTESKINIYGVFDKNVKANGMGSIFWPSGGHYLGWLKNSYQDGFGITGRANYWGSDDLDFNLMGLFSNGKLVTKITQMPMLEYDQDSAKMLSNDYRVVTNLDRGEDGVYSGNWKNGAPIGYGIAKYNCGATVGFANGDKKTYYWCSDYQNSYVETKKKDNVLFIEEVNKTNDYRRIIEPVGGDIKYIYDMAFAKDKNNRNLIISLFKDEGKRFASVGTQAFVSITELSVTTRDFKSYDIITSYTISIWGDMSIRTENDVTIYKPDGTVYVLNKFGRWSDFGVCYYNDGNIYIGYMHLNYEGEYEKEGDGMLLFEDGEIIQSGKWENNKLVSPVLAGTEVSDYDISSVVNAAKKYKTDFVPKLSPSFIINY